MEKVLAVKLECSHKFIN